MQVSERGNHSGVVQVRESLCGGASHGDREVTLGWRIQGKGNARGRLANSTTSKTPYVAIDERGLVRSIHLFLFSCVH